MNSENVRTKKGKRLSSFFRDVAEAISGTEQDFTEGKLSRAILLHSGLSKFHLHGCLQ
jgi:hypothetical protein